MFELVQLRDNADKLLQECRQKLGELDELEKSARFTVEQERNRIRDVLSQTTAAKAELERQLIAQSFTPRSSVH